MKRLITEPKYYITISIWKVDSERIAAEQYLKHLSTIPRSRKISDEELQELNDLIMSVMTVFKVNKFKVLPGKQSSDGYTWYAPFYPVLDTGELLDEILFVFIPLFLIAFKVFLLVFLFSSKVCKLISKFGLSSKNSIYK